MKRRPGPILTLRKGPNKWEREYELLLSIKKRSGEIVDYRWEPMRFQVGAKLAKNGWYTPDFVVITEDCFEVHEVKGQKRGAGMRAFQAAALIYPWFKWILVTKDKETKQWVWTEAT